MINEELMLRNEAKRKRNISKDILFALIAFVHPQSWECAKSELDIFGIPPIQNSIETGGSHWNPNTTHITNTTEYCSLTVKKRVVWGPGEGVFGALNMANTPYLLLGLNSLLIIFLTFLRVVHMHISLIANCHSRSSRCLATGYNSEMRWY